MESTWAERAALAIQRAYNIAREEGKTGDEIVKAIDAAYPFGERAMHPYKMWLKVRRRILSKLGLYQAKKPKATGEFFQ
jgi:hypothetical protein